MFVSFLSDLEQFNPDSLKAFGRFSLDIGCFPPPLIFSPFPAPHWFSRVSGYNPQVASGSSADPSTVWWSLITNGLSGRVTAFLNEGKCSMPRYTKTGLKISRNRWWSDESTFLVQYVVNIYGGDQKRGTAICKTPWGLCHLGCISVVLGIFSELMQSLMQASDAGFWSIWKTSKW